MCCGDWYATGIRHVKIGTEIDQTFLPVFILLHWLYVRCRILASLRINCQVPLSPAIFLQPLKPNCFRSFSASSNYMFLGFPTDIYPSEILINTFFTVLCSTILSTRPNHRNNHFLISDTISGSLHWSGTSCSVRILRTPFSFAGPYVFLNIFLSLISEVLSSLCWVSWLSKHTLLSIYLLYDIQPGLSFVIPQ